MGCVDFLISLYPETNGCYKFQRQKPWLSQFHNITTQRVQDIAQQGGCSVHAVRLPVRINITSVFDEGSAEGSAMLDFLSGVYKFRESVPDGMKSDLLQFLGSPDISINTSDGLVFLRGDQELLLIQK